MAIPYPEMGAPIQNHSRMDQRRQWLYVILIISATLYLFFHMQQISRWLFPSPFHGQELNRKAPDFSLYDIDQTIHTLADSRGSYRILFFGYGECGDVCPFTLARAIEVIETPGIPPTRVIFIDIVPGGSNSYPMLNRPLPPGGVITLHSHDQRTIERIARDYRATVNFSAFGLPEELRRGIDHSAFLYLVDRDNQLRLIYTDQSLRSSQIVEDIALIETAHTDKK